jgi:RimJ/RimL family protein N-acetyltransferase
LATGPGVGRCGGAAITRDGILVGSVGSYTRDGEREVTYAIRREFWGQGLATEALRTYLRDLEPTRPIHGTAAFDNAGSIRVLEKCGFRRVGTGKGFANARGIEIEEVFFQLD